MRREKYKEVREKIVDAAMKIFSTYGYSKASVRLIAKEAGVSKGLIFWYFDSKDKLIKEVGLKVLPIDLIRVCLDKDLDGRELLYCIASKYLDKYNDIEMRRLLLHTMAISDMYLEIGDMINTLCDEMIRKIAERVFGDYSEETDSKIRMFFGSLLCYAMRPPKNVDRDKYIEILVKEILT